MSQDPVMRRQDSTTWCYDFYHITHSACGPRAPCLREKTLAECPSRRSELPAPSPSHTHSKARESQSSLQQRQARLRRAIHRHRERGVTDVSERAWRPIDGQGHTSICRLRSIELVPPPPRDRSETTPPRIERGAQRWCFVFCGRVAQPCVGGGSVSAAKSHVACRS